MKNDFDLDPEDLEFEEFENNLDDFDDFDEAEFGEVQMRTAVLSKNNMVALLCVKTADEGGAICRVDPREINPKKAMEWFTQSLRTSKKNGWQIVYNGLPLQG